MQGNDELWAEVLLADCPKHRVVGSSWDSVQGVNQGLALQIKISEQIKLCQLDGADSIFVVVNIVANIGGSYFVLLVQANLDKWTITTL